MLGAREMDYWGVVGKAVFYVEDALEDIALACT